MTNGPMLAALLAAKAMLRDCYYWRRINNLSSELVTVWDAEQAEQHIYFDGLPRSSTGADHTRAELELLRPFAILWHDVAAGFRRRFDSAGNCGALSAGTTIMQIELPVPIELSESPDQLATELNTRFGRLVGTADATKPGLTELSGKTGYLPLLDLQVRGYIRTDDKAKLEIGDAVVAEFELRWGQE